MADAESLSFVRSGSVNAMTQGRARQTHGRENGHDYFARHRPRSAAARRRRTFLQTQGLSRKRGVLRASARRLRPISSRGLARPPAARSRRRSGLAPRSSKHSRSGRGRTPLRRSGPARLPAPDGSRLNRPWRIIVTRSMSPSAQRFHPQIAVPGVDISARENASILRRYGADH